MKPQLVIGIVIGVICFALVLPLAMFSTGWYVYWGVTLLAVIFTFAVISARTQYLEED